jgi:integrase
MTLGDCSKISIVIARKMTKERAGMIAAGVDPVAEVKADKIKAKTLAEVIEDYILARSLKATTVKDLRTAMRQFGELVNKPIPAITEDMIREHHSRRGAESKARANLEIRYIKALLNFAASAYKIDGKRIIEVNPAKIIGEEKRTHKVQRKRTRIHAHQFAPWLNAVQSLDSEWKDYFLLLIATGLRRQEALDLCWDDVDLGGGILIVRDTKNGQDHELPIPLRTWEALKARKARYDARTKDKQIGYVFSDEYGDRMTNPRYAVANLKQRSGVASVNPHDLRRSFASIADELDLGKYTVKRLLNHSDNGDVTAGYISISLDKLRRAIQEIEDTIYGGAS